MFHCRRHACSVTIAAKFIVVINQLTSSLQNIIPRESHSVARTNISQAALNVLDGLYEAGYEAYLVGGAVRDVLIGLTPKDFDVATNATPEQVKQVFPKARLIGRRFRLAHVRFGREVIEVSTFRAQAADVENAHKDEHKTVDGRIVRDNVFGTVEEDAQRRDFTVNALYYNVADGSVRDDTNAMADIKQRLLRLIGEPEVRFVEDPVRMLRAVRLSAKLGFEIEAHAKACIHSHKHLLEGSSNARLFDETIKMFLAGHGVKSFEGLEQFDLLQVLFPDTHKALALDESGACRALIMRALQNTDERVAMGKSVTPAFLYASLLWPSYTHHLQKACQRMERQQSDAKASLGSWSSIERDVMNDVIVRQCRQTAIPRRFSQFIHEMWMMQPRFASRNKQRVPSLLDHARFRAAFDFLEVRHSVVAALADDVSFWQQAQKMSRDALDEWLDQFTDDAPAFDAIREAPRSQRRRRRRPRRQKKTNQDVVG